jgi:hypothetical protein
MKLQEGGIAALQEGKAEGLSRLSFLPSCNAAMLQCPL